MVPTAGLQEKRVQCGYHSHGYALVLPILSHHLPTHIHIFTLQRACAPSSAHYPSPGRTGGPWTGSQAARGKRPCTPRRGVLSSRRSGSSSATSFASVRFSPASPTTYVLVDQQDSNVLALRGEAVKGRLDGAVLRLGVHDEEVLLRVWRLGYVLRWVSLLLLFPLR